MTDKEEIIHVGEIHHGAEPVKHGGVGAHTGQQGQVNGGGEPLDDQRQKVQQCIHCRGGKAVAGAHHGKGSQSKEENIVQRQTAQAQQGGEPKLSHKGHEVL